MDLVEKKKGTTSWDEDKKSPDILRTNRPPLHSRKHIRGKRLVIYKRGTTIHKNPRILAATVQKKETLRIFDDEKAKNSESQEPVFLEENQSHLEEIFT